MPGILKQLILILSVSLKCFSCVHFSSSYSQDTHSYVQYPLNLDQVLDFLMKVIDGMTVLALDAELVA